jgi:hypothetical protein
MKPDPKKDPKSEPPGQVSKQRYEKPELIAYGDIAALTRMVGKSGAGDGGHGNMMKSAP